MNHRMMLIRWPLVLSVACVALIWFCAGCGAKSDLAERLASPDAAPLLKALGDRSTPGANPGNVFVVGRACYAADGRVTPMQEQKIRLSVWIQNRWGGEPSDTLAGGPCDVVTDDNGVFGFWVDGALVEAAVQRNGDMSFCQLGFSGGEKAGTPYIDRRGIRHHGGRLVNEEAIRLTTIRPGLCCLVPDMMFDPE